MALITCQNASFGYDGTTVVSNLNFEINSGDYVCIIGENGSGKSTLIKGLLQLKSPQKGSLIMGDGLKAKEIGYLPQQSAAQKDFPASVWEVVISGRLSARGIFPFYSAEDKKIAKQNLKLLGIEDLKNKCYRELSGGQQQRVLLARALCATQKVLLLDEPVSGLDPKVTQEFYNLMEKINKTEKIAIIMVSHDIQSAVKYADYILHLHNKQLFYGKKEDYVNSLECSCFLGGQND